MRTNRAHGGRVFYLLPKRVILIFSVFTVFLPLFWTDIALAQGGDPNGDLLGNVQTVFLRTDENVEARGPNTRVWYNVYRLEDPNSPLDPDDPSLIIRRRILQKGTNINYVSGYDEAGKPVYSPVVTEFAQGGGDFRWKVETGAAKVHIRNTPSGREWIRYEYAGEVMEIGIPSLAIFDPESDTYELLESPDLSSVTCNGNTIRITDAFTDMDLELVYNPGEFHVNLIVKAGVTLPSSKTQDVDEENSWIGAFSACGNGF